MKHFLVLFLSVLANLLTAQTVPTDLNLFTKAEFETAIIHFNDGTSIEGIGRLKTVFTSREEVIVFKIKEADKDEIWTVKDVSGITIISEDGDAIHYEYLKVSKSSFAELYEVVTEGFVKLYKKRHIVTPSKSSPNFPEVTTGREVSTYYLKKETDTYPTKLKGLKTLSEYMKDCEIVLERIMERRYNDDNYKEAVDNYNANCGA